MPVDLPYKLIFIHIPKTAGTSFIELLRQTYGEENVLQVGHKSPPDLLTTWQSEKFKDYVAVCGHAHAESFSIVAGPKLYIAFAREPIARLLSWYKHCKRTANHPMYGFAREYPADDFFEICARIALEQDPPSPPEGVSPVAVKANALTIVDHQCFYISGQRSFGAVRELARLGRRMLLSTVEGLPAMVSRLSERLAWEKSELPRLNVSKPDEEAGISEKTRQRLERLNSQDALLYSFLREREAGEDVWREIPPADPK